MYFLNTMAFLTILCLSVSALGYGEPWNFEDENVKKRCIMTIFSSIVGFALYVSVVLRMKQASLDYDELPELVSACLPYRDILPGIPTPPGANNTQAMQDLQHYADAMGYTSTTGFVLWSTLGLPVRFILGFLMLAAAAGILFTLFWFGLFIVGCFVKFPKLIGGILSVAFWIGLTYCLSQLLKKRQQFGEVLGEQYQDNEWGFGQVLAVFAWIPLLLEALPGLSAGMMWLFCGRKFSPVTFHLHSIIYVGIFLASDYHCRPTYGSHIRSAIQASRAKNRS